MLVDFFEVIVKSLCVLVFFVGFDFCNCYVVFYCVYIVKKLEMCVCWIE